MIGRDQSEEAQHQKFTKNIFTAEGEKKVKNYCMQYFGFKPT